MNPRAVRLPPLLAIVVAITMYALLPARVSVGPPWLVPVVEGLLGVVLVAVRTGSDGWVGAVGLPAGLDRVVSVVLVVVLAGFNLAALAVVVADALSPAGRPPSDLFAASVQIFVTNVVVFGLLYSEMDRGGPVARRRASGAPPDPDFQFPQDTSPPAGRAWHPEFVDYLYVSFTNCTAYSPTDTMPLRRRAKAAMTLESAVSLLTAVVIVAKAVGAVGS